MSHQVSSLAVEVEDNGTHYRIEMRSLQMYRVLERDDRGLWDVEVEPTKIPTGIKRTIEWMQHAFRNM